MICEDTGHPRALKSLAMAALRLPSVATTVDFFEIRRLSAESLEANLWPASTNLWRTALGRPSERCRTSSTQLRNGKLLPEGVGRGLKEGIEEATAHVDSSTDASKDAS